MVDARSEERAKARALSVVLLERRAIEDLDEEILREIFGVST